ncbi:MAG TPA: hypothetical protein PKV13_01290 [Propionicimonas sp.]|nr:hypothetical protein [Propionicimonas sp.]
MAFWGGQTAAVTTDWRQEASVEDLREYDAFGPWIDPVRSADDMPRVFRRFYPELAESRILLKVPKDVERAQARPGDDLYAAVLAVRERGITMLRLRPDGVDRRDVAWPQVVGVTTYLNLLVSRWTLLLADGDRFELDYNSVGVHTMAAVTDHVRAQLTLGIDASRQPALGSVRISDDFFATRFAQLTRTFDAAAVALHFEPRNRLCRDSAGRRRLSTGVLLVDTPQELVILNRGEPTRRLFEANYASGVTYAPYTALTSYTVLDPEPRRSFRTLVLQAGDQQITQPCLEDPEQARPALAARGIPRTAP